MKVIDYEKRKNKELFSDFKKLKSINVDKIQNYDNFFADGGFALVIFLSYLYRVYQLIII